MSIPSRPLRKRTAQDLVERITDPAAGTTEREIAVTDLLFNFGPDDWIGWLLGPDDLFSTFDDKFVIQLKADHELIEIDRARVRFWSQRHYKQTVRVPLDPAVAHDTD